MHFALSRNVVVTATVIASLVFAASSAVAHDGPSPTAVDGPLKVGASRFWVGPTLSGSMSACGKGCASWPLEVSPGGARLRVALDTPVRSNTLELLLIDPNGNKTSATNSNAFDAEVFVNRPNAGKWTVEVFPQGATRASVRLRAKLEKTLPALPKTRKMLLPDLAAVPPLEVTFIAPANPANGVYPPDTVNPPLDVLGIHPLSCTVDEMAPASIQGGSAQRCLRFTSGPMNVGAGPYEMHWNYLGDLLSGKLTSPIAHGPISQTVHWTTGPNTTRAAGTYSFHVIHAHFHDDGVLSMELLKVNGDSTLTKVGVGTKSGFCPANQLLANWRSFRNESADAAIGSGDVATGNCQGVSDGVLGLSPGWGDVYRWQRPGMYVEFGDQPDGLYVIRITIDVRHEVLETNYDNNTAYALVKVVGDTVAELERGQGQSPFDPRKVVFTGSGPASRD